MKVFKEVFEISFEISELERDLVKNTDTLIYQVAENASVQFKAHIKEKLDKFFKEWDNSEIKAPDFMQEEGVKLNPDGTLVIA